MASLCRLHDKGGKAMAAERVRSTIQRSLAVNKTLHNIPKALPTTISPNKPITLQAIKRQATV